ncbi:MFS transporter [soil metagenome]
MRRSDAVRLALYLGLVTSTMGFRQPFLAVYMASAGLDKFQIGIVQGLGAAFALLIQPFIGRWSDRLDARRPFIIGAAVLAAAVYFMYPLAQSFAQFAVLEAIGANAYMYLSAVGAVLVGRMVQAARGGAAYANLRIWGSVGYIVVSLVSGLSVRDPASVTHAGLASVFHYGPLLFVLIAILAPFLPDAKRDASSGAPQTSPMTPNLRRFLLALALYTLALYGASGFLPLYMKSFGAGGLWISGAFAAGVVVEVLIMRQAGRFSDRYGRRPALVAAFLLLPVRLLLYVPATGPAWILAVQSLHGVNFGIVGAVAVAFANDLANDHNRGHAQARLAVAQGFASASGPFILGWVAQNAGLRPMFGVASGIAAVAAVILLIKVEDSHKEVESWGGRFRWLQSPVHQTKPECLR